VMIGSTSLYFTVLPVLKSVSANRTPTFRHLQRPLLLSAPLPLWLDRLLLVLRKGENTVPPHGDEVDKEELEPQGDDSKGEDLGGRPNLVILEEGRHNLLLDLVRVKFRVWWLCFGFLNKS